VNCRAALSSVPSSNDNLKALFEKEKMMPAEKKIFGTVPGCSHDTVK
jgi:hypothetical protein